MKYLPHVYELRLVLQRIWQQRQAAGWRVSIVSGRRHSYRHL